MSVNNLLYDLAKFKQITVKETNLPEGLYGFIKGNRIAIKSEVCEEKKVYTLAHELAHYYLHFDKGNILEGCDHSNYEDQADRAASMLLDFMKVLKIQNSINAAHTDQSKSCI